MLDYPLCNIAFSLQMSHAWLYSLCSFQYNLRYDCKLVFEGDILWPGSLSSYIKLLRLLPWKLFFNWEAFGWKYWSINHNLYFTWIPSWETQWTYQRADIHHPHNIRINLRNIDVLLLLIISSDWLHLSKQDTKVFGSKLRTGQCRIGREGAGRKLSVQFCFIFMQFSGETGQRLVSPPLRLASPTSGESWIRHCICLCWLIQGGEWPGCLLPHVPSFNFIIYSVTFNGEWALCSGWRYVVQEILGPPLIFNLILPRNTSWGSNGLSRLYPPPILVKK